MNPTQKARLTAMIGKSIAVYCDDDGGKMIVRQNRQDQTFFLGCQNYPDCRHTQEIDEAVYMQIMKPLLRPQPLPKMRRMW